MLDSRGVGVVFSLVLFGISFIGNTWQREQQRVEMKRQADDLRDIRARLEELDSPAERERRARR